LNTCGGVSGRGTAGGDDSRMVCFGAEGISEWLNLS